MLQSCTSQHGTERYWKQSKSNFPKSRVNGISWMDIIAICNNISLIWGGFEVDVKTIGLFHGSAGAKLMVHEWCLNTGITRVICLPISRQPFIMLLLATNQIFSKVIIMCFFLYFLFHILYFHINHLEYWDTNAALSIELWIFVDCVVYRMDVVGIWLIIADSDSLLH